MIKNKDVDLKILSELRDRDLLNMCASNKETNNLCNDKYFWINRFISRYRKEDYEIMKDKITNWRNFMLLLIKYFDMAKMNEKHNFVDGFFDTIDIETKEGQKYILNFALRYAIKENQMAVTEFLILQGANSVDGILAASEVGNENLVKYFISSLPKGYIDNYNYYNYVIFGAAKGGNKNMFDKYISKVDNDVQVWEIGLMYAKEGGDKYIIDFFAKKVKEMPMEEY